MLAFFCIMLSREVSSRFTKTLDWVTGDKARGKSRIGGVGGVDRLSCGDDIAERESDAKWDFELISGLFFMTNFHSYTRNEKAPCVLHAPFWLVIEKTMILEDSPESLD